MDTRERALEGKRVAILMTDGVEQVEYTRPRQFLEQEGASVTLVSPKKKGEQIQGFNHLTPGDKFAVELNIQQTKSADYDALMLPGGVANPDALRLSKESIAFIRSFAESAKPIAAICHGAWPLIDAGVASGKRMTSWPSLQADLRNAGAQWTDEPVVVDGNLVTSRKPEDIPAFNEAMVEAFAAAPVAGRA